jgi:hypothetical protein
MPSLNARYSLRFRWLTSALLDIKAQREADPFTGNARALIEQEKLIMANTLTLEALAERLDRL